MHGRNGSSQPHPIGDCPENFEQGERDVFTVSLPDLGTITAVTVSHDGTGPYPEWHLDRMEMRNRRSGEHYTFPCSRWVGRDGGGGSVRLEAVRQVVSGEANEEGREGASLANGPSEDYGSDQFESSSEAEEEGEEEEEEEAEEGEGEEEGTNQGVSELDSSITNEVRVLHSPHTGKHQPQIPIPLTLASWVHVGLNYGRGRQYCNDWVLGRGPSIHSGPWVAKLRVAPLVITSHVGVSPSLTAVHPSVAPGPVVQH